MIGTNRTENAGFLFQRPGIAIWVAMSCALLCASAMGSNVTSNVIANNTPSYVGTAKNLRPEDPAKVIEVSIWLQLHNRSEFECAHGVPL